MRTRFPESWSPPTRSSATTWPLRDFRSRADGCGQRRRGSRQRPKPPGNDCYYERPCSRCGHCQGSSPATPRRGSEHTRCRQLSDGFGAQQAAPTRRSTVIFGRRTPRANEIFKSTGVFAWPRTRGQFRISGELQPLNFCRTLPWRRERICQAGSMAGLNITKRCSSQCVASPDRAGQAFYDRACSLKPEGIVSKGVDTLRPWQSRPVAQGQTPEPRGVRG